MRPSGILKLALITIFFLLNVPQPTNSTIYGNLIPMLNTSQYHFVPFGSYLQFSISSAVIGEGSLMFSESNPRVTQFWEI